MNLRDLKLKGDQLLPCG